jgi:hypothetical protein
MGAPARQRRDMYTTETRGNYVDKTKEGDYDAAKELQAHRAADMAGKASHFKLDGGVNAISEEDEHRTFHCHVHGGGKVRSAYCCIKLFMGREGKECVPLLCTTTVK